MMNNLIMNNNNLTQHNLFSVNHTVQLIQLTVIHNLIHIHIHIQVQTQI